MSHIRSVVAGLALLLAGAIAPSAQRAAQVPAPFRASNHRPRMTLDVPREAQLHTGDVVRFRLRITDRDGDRVSLHLVHPPAGWTLEPIVERETPLEVEGVWRIPSHSGGLVRLLFEVSDGHGPARTVMHPVHLVGDHLPNGMFFDDVTGDGKPDIVGTATRGWANGLFEQGVLLLWEGGGPANGPADAELTVPSLAKSDWLGSVPLHTGVQLGDVTGDGIADVVAPTTRADTTNFNAGGVFVWAGGPGLLTDPTVTASLVSSDGWGTGDLGISYGTGVMLYDIDADGVRDVVATMPGDGNNGNTGPGAIYVWLGGPGLVGTKDRSAKLLVPGSVAGDWLGKFGDQCLLFEDVNADGLGDLLACTQASLNGGDDNGAVVVWFGGPGFTGNRAPDATLTLPSGARIGSQAFRVGDVTGDGLPDVVATQTLVASADAGAVLVFEGGPGLAGTVLPRAVLPPPHGGEMYPTSGKALKLRDVTGDGVLDVLACYPTADPGGIQDAGVLGLWVGGPGLTGTLSGTTLIASDAGPFDQLGNASLLKSDAAQGFLVEDLNGDGIDDVLAVAPRARPLEPAAAGALHLWFGRASFPASLSSDLVLLDPDARPQDRLGDSGGQRQGQGVILEDVTGDGYLDVLALAVSADLGAIADAGAVHVWHGGPDMAPALLPALIAPDATLTRATPQAGDSLGDGPGQSLAAVDVTGDGVRDVLVASHFADVLGSPADGGVFVFEGGPSLSGDRVPTAVAGPSRPYETTSRIAFGTGEGMRIVDFDRDGVLDLLLGTDRLGDSTLYVFRGGPTMSGAAPVGARLDTLGVFDELNNANGLGTHLIDLDRNGVLDVVSGAMESDYQATDSGVFFLWLNPTAFQQDFTGRLHRIVGYFGDRLGT